MIWADAEIRPDATVDEIREVAKAWAWQHPLKIFVPDIEDPRVQLFIEILDNEYFMEPDQYRVFEPGGCEVDVALPDETLTSRPRPCSDGR